ncbi:MAG: hypothetical protein HGB35_09275 [Geobacteraceae bacterium]|nr:hypothetical protein [Geobacteraceae bacterium]
MELVTVNGNTTCKGTEGAAQLQATNGNLRVSGCRGRVEARTQNGNINAAVDELRQEGVFTTTNGTAVDGRLIQKILLKAEMRITLGETELVFKQPEPEISLQ